MEVRDRRPLVLTGAAVLFALLAGGPLAYTLAYLLIGVTGFSYLWVRYVPSRLECGVSSEKRYSERGARIKVQVWVENPTLLPVTWLELHEDPAAARVPLGDLHLGAEVAPGETRMDFLWLYTPRRGMYTVGPLHVTTGDPFGIFAVRRTHASSAVVTVLPRVVPLQGLEIPLGQPFGPHRTRNRVFEDPSNLANLRDYRAGDSPRHIHWKATARYGELQVREYELHATTSLAVLLDLHASEGDVQEAAVEAAASIAALALARNLEVELLTYGGDRIHLPPAKGLRQRARLLEALSRADAKGAPVPGHLLLHEVRRLSHRSTLVFVTTGVGPDVAGGLLRLASLRPVMLVLIGGDEAAASMLARWLTVYRLGPDDDLTDLIRRKVEPGTGQPAYPARHAGAAP